MRRLCENFAQIDIRKMDFQRNSSWQCPPPSGIMVAVVDDAVQVIQGSRILYIAIERTACNYGGSRPWFLCPGCRGRCAVLYESRYGFECRCCLRLVHTSVTEDKFDRLRRKRGKLLERLKDFDVRPKWKRRTTFETLYQQQLKAEFDAVFWLTRRIGK